MPKEIRIEYISDKETKQQFSFYSPNELLHQRFNRFHEVYQIRSFKHLLLLL